MPRGSLLILLMKGDHWQDLSHLSQLLHMSRLFRLHRHLLPCFYELLRGEQGEYTFLSLTSSAVFLILNLWVLIWCVISRPCKQT